MITNASAAKVFADSSGSLLHDAPQLLELKLGRALDLQFHEVLAGCIPVATPCLNTTAHPVNADNAMARLATCLQESCRHLQLLVSDHSDAHMPATSCLQDFTSFICDDGVRDRPTENSGRRSGEYRGSPDIGGSIGSGGTHFQQGLPAPTHRPLQEAIAACHGVVSVFSIPEHIAGQLHEATAEALPYVGKALYPKDVPYVLHVYTDGTLPQPGIESKGAHGSGSPAWAFVALAEPSQSTA